MSMEKISAWAAVLMAAMFAVNAYFQFATGVPGWIYVFTALMLGLGAYRTLRKMSGGLRLLCGAWGFGAGILAAPLSYPRPLPISPIEIAFVAIALAGLAMTVLHKEKKALTNPAASAPDLRDPPSPAPGT